VKNCVSIRIIVEQKPNFVLNASNRSWIKIGQPIH
jgi:hypothetical protein